MSSSATAYFDCINGAAGDMIVAALLDAGADADALRRGLDSVGLVGYEVEIAKANKQGYAATHFVVRLDESQARKHRHLRDVVALISGSPLSEPVKHRAITVFERLADAEAAVHGTTREKVHFHEVGAVDAILDIVGASLALELLGVTRVKCSAIPVGSGTVVCEHGVMPVPAPATARLLEGFPLAATDETGELTTPTGAAVLTALAQDFGPLPSMQLLHVGCGAGTRDGRRRPNLLRVFVGREVENDSSQADQVIEIQANLDKATPEQIGYCMERLLAAGALDVFATPIQMKKWRPGVLLTVLAEPGLAGQLEAVLFAETGTLGLRHRMLSRAKLPRTIETVETRFGRIRMKVTAHAGTRSAAPEFEDCRAAAATQGLPLREVIAEAEAAWRLLSTGRDASE